MVDILEEGPLGPAFNKNQYEKYSKSIRTELEKNRGRSNYLTEISNDFCSYNRSIAQYNNVLNAKKLI